MRVHHPTAEQFRATLDGRLAQAQQAGYDHVEVKSGDLHRELGDYPGSDHRMPVCCGVMRAAMRPGDQIISEPPSGQGATLIIRYKLPR